jgi:hypothetical protein
MTLWAANCRFVPETTNVRIQSTGGSCKRKSLIIGAPGGLTLPIPGLLPSG